jgi:three-Cys-motif partner protein
MASKDIFDEPFNEGTLTKLEIFEKYFEEWLPTFVLGNINKPIRVFDLFAGVGYDKIHQEGSPIRILKIVNKYRGILINQKKTVSIYLNDSDLYKYKALKANVENKIFELSLSSFVELTITNNTFKECLNKYNCELINGCNLLFIDQNGFKEVSEETFQYLIKLETTEFIFFISSSHIHRFAVLPDVQNIHPKFDFNKIRNTSRKKVHNIICEEYEKYIPHNISSYGLIPYSIIKSDNNNVYGLIFVSKHIRGADKFLDTVWRKNPINGNANFDIDDDLSKAQIDLFFGKRLTKIETFQNYLIEKILKGEICNNMQAYVFTLNRGHIHQHADQVIRDLKRNNIIAYDGKSPLVNYDQVVKNKRIINYRVIDENYKNRMD